ncbi:MAG: chromate transporter [Saccharofermentanales bacterium]
MIFWQLFIAFLEVGAFAFGGGYAALPLIEQVAVNRYHWLTLTEMTDIIALSQVTPGPIALNAATFVGTRVAGFPGAIVASLAAVLPQTLFLLFLGWFMFYGGRTTAIDRALKGLRPGITGLIAAATVSMFISTFIIATGPLTIDWIAAAAFLIVIVLRIRKVSLTKLIFLGAGLGLAGGLIEHLVRP